MKNTHARTITKGLILALAWGSIFITGSARAQIVHVNMYASSGGNQNPEDPASLEGPAGGLGETWNQFNTTMGSALLDATGAPTSIGFSNNVGSGWAWGNPDLGVLQAGRAHFGKGDDTTHTITGLNPGNLYDIWIACAAINTTIPERSAGTWSTPNPTTTVGAQAISNLAAPNGSTWEYGNNFVRFEQVEADTKGEIMLYGDAAEGSRLPLSGFQITPGGTREPLEMTDIVYDLGRDEITLTWKSNPGEFYGLYWTGSMIAGFMPGIHPAVSAHASEKRTTYGPFANPNPGTDRLLLRVGPPDLEDPILERLWGNDTTVRLSFSEALHTTAATNPANFSVRADDVLWPITSAALSPDGRTITLTTGAPLGIGTSYTVTINNLTDLAGRPLGNPTVRSFQTWDNNPNGVKVFILAGQSNMVGHGKSEKGVGDVDGAIGSLRYQVVNDPVHYSHLVDAGSNWVVRSDVKVWWRDNDIGATRAVLKGDLGIGFAQSRNPDWIGPEYGFGWALGDYYTEPVLLIKTSWGGKSLNEDFRPPSAVAGRGGAVGPYYIAMIEYVRDVLSKLGTEFPEWAGMGYQVAGVGWHQGWNDRIDATNAAAYEDNLVDLINDLRAEFGRPELPISIGTTGMDPQATYGPVELAQLAVADPAQHPGFTGTVFTVDTRDFWRDSSVSPSNFGFHWNHNGETHFLIGDAMGEGMVELLTP